MSAGRYDRLAHRVAELRSAGLERRLRRVVPIDATRAAVDGAVVTLFCTNDYLGLAHDPDVVAAYTGAGAGASRLISGNRPAHEALEADLEAVYGRPVTLFTSGYAANLALYTTVLGRGDLVASDALNHASMIDGLRLSGATRRILPHLSTDAPPDAALIAVEGLFSMDGDQLDLSRYPRAPWLSVDEAHAFGCLGPDGRGVAAAQGVEPDFVVATLGKAVGAAGAFVVGPPELKPLLVSLGRAFVYTTGLPEPVANAARVGLRKMDDARRARLASNTRRLREALAQLGVAALGDAHIVPIVLGSASMHASARLQEAGFLVPAVRWPTVPRGEERLRITLSAAHTAAQIDALAEAIAVAAP